MVYLNNSLKEDLFTGLCDFNPNENIYVLLLHVPPQYPPLQPTNIVNIVCHFRDDIIMIARVINHCTCSNVNINPNI